MTDLPCGLSRQQLRVVAGRARGRSNAEIAADLGLTLHQVKAAVRGAAKRLGVEQQGMAAVVDAGYRTGVLRNLPPEPRPGMVLSIPRQQLLRRLAVGLTDRQIARLAKRSHNTTRTNVKALLHQVGARDREHAVALAHQHGWLDGPAGSAALGDRFGVRVRVGYGRLVHAWDGSRLACSSELGLGVTVVVGAVSCGTCRKRLGLVAEAGR